MLKRSKGIKLERDEVTQEGFEPYLDAARTSIVKSNPPIDCRVHDKFSLLVACTWLLINGCFFFFFFYLFWLELARFGDGVMMCVFVLRVRL